MNRFRLPTAFLVGLLGSIALALLMMRPSGEPVMAGQTAAPPGTQRAYASRIPDLSSISSALPNDELDSDEAIPLKSGALRSAVELLLTAQGVPQGVDLIGSGLRVEVLHTLASTAAQSLITELGGTIEGEVPGVLVQAVVPVEKLAELESRPGIQFLRPPLRVDIPLGDQPNGGSRTGSSPRKPLASGIVGEEVAKTRADWWQTAGFTGSGVKIGIVDYFDGSVWNAAVAAGELPSAAGTFCRVAGSTCDLWTAAAGMEAAKHGEAVAEIIHEMAPGASLYLAMVVTASDLQAAVDYFAAQGVRIISRSLTSVYDGPGDGTGAVDAVINSAVAAGMAWFNAAGNNSGDSEFPGSYWRGNWVDGNNDGWMEFAPGDSYLGFFCGGMNGIRWSDWGSNRTDYDVYIYDDVGDFTPISRSRNRQGAGAPPIEADLQCTPGDIDFLAIRRYAPGSGTSGDVLEFMVNQSMFEYWQNPYSASGPASDSSSAGALTVGAIDPPMETDMAGYSSWGPTNDGRMKPDITAAAGVSSYTYEDGFPGTSAATPTAAGAAALVLGAGLANSPDALKTWLLNNATADRGAAGPDNAYGRGELILPVPPGSSPSPSPSPSPSASPSSSPSPTPSGSPGARVKGDVDCNGPVDAVDALKLLRAVAGLPVSQNEPCPDIGSGVPKQFGDINCGNGVDAVDALFVLRYVASLPVNVPAGCPAIGS